MHVARHVNARLFRPYPNDKKEDAKWLPFRPVSSPCKLYFLQEFSGYVEWFSGEDVLRVGFRPEVPMVPVQSIRFLGRTWGTTRPLALRANPMCGLVRFSFSLGLQVARPGTPEVTSPRPHRK
jgi:hypothetical protein